MDKQVKQYSRSKEAYDENFVYNAWPTPSDLMASEWHGINTSALTAAFSGSKLDLPGSRPAHQLSRLLLPVALLSCGTSIVARWRSGGIACWPSCFGHPVELRSRQTGEHHPQTFHRRHHVGRSHLRWNQPAHTHRPSLSLWRAGVCCSELSCLPKHVSRRHRAPPSVP